jgi:hypothetical protein
MLLQNTARLHFSQARLGYKLQKVFVQHPISDQTRAQLVAKADAAYADVVHALTSNDPPAEDDEEDDKVVVSVDASAECST